MPCVTACGYYLPSQSAASSRTTRCATPSMTSIVPWDWMEPAFCLGDPCGRRLRDLRPASPSISNRRSHFLSVGREISYRRHTAPASRRSCHVRTQQIRQRTASTSFMTPPLERYLSMVSPGEIETISMDGTPYLVAVGGAVVAHRNCVCRRL
jgi:hypothetical protein